MRACSGSHSVLLDLVSSYQSSTFRGQHLAYAWSSLACHWSVQWLGQLYSF